MADPPDLILTTSAAERLQELFVEAECPHRRLRIEVTGSADSPSVDLSMEPQSSPDWIEIDYACISVVLDPESRRRLRGCELAYHNEADGEYFVIRSGFT